jgi:hypothetical protein
MSSLTLQYLQIVSSKLNVYKNKIKNLDCYKKKKKTTINNSTTNSED